jgi:hypothetical protein
MVTHAKKLGGKPFDHYNGVDLTVSARLSNGIQLSGGSSTGRSEQNYCYVVDSPQQSGAPASTTTGPPTLSGLKFCDYKPPFQTQFKFIAVYPLPWWGLQTSASFLNIPGPQITAEYVATNAEIRPSLGRNLAAGANATATLPIIEPATLFGERAHKLDVRFTKSFDFGTRRLRGSLDIFNIFNTNSVVGYNIRYGPNWLDETDIMSPRYFRIAAQVDF